ncbi:MAG: hypothetical protein P8M20_07785 [Planctomycetaceae bacterium]|jgi:hypothetical protein|nr:hypothetical protein [Planctomycetaceae bacterium]
MSSTPEDTGNQKRESVSVDVFRLVVASLVFALVLAGPAWLVAGDKGLVGLAAAAVLCTLPGCLVVAFKGLVGDSQATLVLAAGGLRMFFVLLGALMAKFVVEGYGLKEFFVWLILFYLFTLALETKSLLSVKSESEENDEAG